jgi:hypothetical protein
MSLSRLISPSVLALVFVALTPTARASTTAPDAAASVRESARSVSSFVDHHRPVPHHRPKPPHPKPVPPGG